jgi:hypothetical protein
MTRTRRARTARRPLATLGTLTLLAAGLVAVAAPAAPAYAAACTSTKTGVTVVVDFTKLGEKIDTACDPTNPANGLDALTGAGFTYAFVPRYPGFVCTIDNLPDPCNGAPATAYWSYWHAKRGGTWIYSNTGAGTYKPKPGSVQGWAFGAGSPPGISPP